MGPYRTPGKDEVIKDISIKEQVDKIISMFETTKCEFHQKEKSIYSDKNIPAKAEIKINNQRFRITNGRLIFKPGSTDLHFPLTFSQRGKINKILKKLGKKYKEKQRLELEERYKKDSEEKKLEEGRIAIKIREVLKEIGEHLDPWWASYKIGD